MTEKEKALKEAIAVLQGVKEIIADLNRFVIKNELLKIEVAELVECKPQVTSVLQISCECDEQIGKLEEFNAYLKDRLKELTL